MPPKFIDVFPGAQVRSGQSLFIVDSKTTADTLLARNAATGSYETLHVTQVVPATAVDDSDIRRPPPDLVADAAGFAKAQARLVIIAPLVRKLPRTRADVEAAAKTAGTSVATVYKWMRTYEDSPQVSSLIPDRPGPDKGERLLDPKQEAIIVDAINKNLKVRQRHRVAVVAQVVEDMCTTAGLRPPHANTVRARVRELPRAEVLRSQGRADEARNTLEPAIGALPGADAPLSVVQMDHSRADVLVVDDRLRLPLGRPWVTVAMDVHTRMIVGIVVSLESPSSFAAGRCIANSMLTKDAYLRSLKVPGEWVAWGRPKVLHMDNAREFRGELLTTSCEEYGIELRLRKVKTPHYGGHIERLMRTFSDAVRNLPGATFSNPDERKGYDSEAKAVMSLDEFEAWLVDYIVNIYHQKPHHGLNGLSPAAKWRESVLGTADAPGIGLPSLPADPERMKLDFLPFTRRTMGRRGIRMDYIDYWHDSFRRRIGEADPEKRKLKRKFLLRVDPRDVTRVWFLDPETNSYVMTPTLNLSRPAVSRWEWKAVECVMRQENRKKVDEEGLFNTRARLLERVEQSTTRSKTARRDVQRAEQAERHAAKGAAKSEDTTARSQDTAPVVSHVQRMDEEMEVLPFDDIDPNV